MAELNKVVAHYADGTLIKGTTADFNVGKPSFHLNPLSGTASIEVHCRSLKAVFFVKDFKGSAQAPGSRGFTASGSNPGGKRIAVLFKDGELLCGFTLTYVPGREGFFMFPADSSSNNIRMFVVNAAVDEVRVGTEANELVNRVTSERSRTVTKA